MTTRRLEAQIRRQQKVAIIDLEGDIDSQAEETLNAAFAEAADKDTEAVLINFKNVDYINSTGIALIVGLLSLALKANVRLLTSGLSDHYAEIFRITRLSDFMSIYSDEEDAVTKALGADK